MPDDRPVSAVTELNKRSREIFRLIVDSYVNNGEPVGSRTVARQLGSNLSAATVRNVMADLEEAGLLTAPHTSAGRLPTDAGIRLFVDGLLEIGEIAGEERERIEALCAAAGRSLPEALNEATTLLSGLSKCAGLVAAPKTDRPLKHIEFVQLGFGRTLVVMVTEDGLVENRLLELPPDVPQSALLQATNYLNARTNGRTLHEAREEIVEEIAARRSQLDDLAQTVVEAGMAVWSGDKTGTLIVKGQANLLEDVHAIEQLDRIRNLFAQLETQETMMRLLDATGQAEGIQLFIGAENHLFADAGCSMIVAPYHNAREQVVGAIGVIGPTRMNYARIIPMVDYTAQILSRLVG